MKFLTSAKKRYKTLLNESWLIVTIPCFVGISVLHCAVLFYTGAEFAHDFVPVFWILFVFHVEEKWKSTKKKKSRSHPSPKKKNMSLIKRNKKKEHQK
jgi:hypothetical protein